jgi:hypothetical protein
MPTTTKGTITTKILAKKVGKKGPQGKQTLSKGLKAAALKNGWDRWEVTEVELGVDELAAYVSLQQRLASFEQLAIYHFLGGADAKERTKRAASLKKQLNQFAAKQFEVGRGDPEIDCPVGWHWCRDHCQNYPCEDNGDG